MKGLACRKNFFALTLIVLLFQVSAVNAQTRPDAGSLREQLERGRQPILPNAIPPIPARPQAEKQPGDTAIIVTVFRFTGNTLFSAEQLSAALATYLNRPLSFAELQDAAAAISSVYRKAGWVVRSFLPDQDIKDGAVTIQIIEASFGGVKFEGDSPSRVKPNQLVDIVNTHQKTGALLNAEAIDRALLIADDLPGVAVTGSLRQGAKRGETELVISAADEPLLTSDFSLDNTGSRATDPFRMALNVGLSSAVGLGEQISLTVNHTKGSDYTRVGATFPLGNHGWRIGANASYLEFAVVTEELLALNIKGRSGSVGMEATYPLIRTLLRNLYFSANYDRKTFNNQANGEVSSLYKAQTFALSLNGNLVDSAGGGGLNTANLSLVRGDINLDGSPSQAGDADTIQTAGRFTKMRYGLTRQQAISARVSLFASLSGQHAQKNLDSSEKFSLGGSSGVRAYPTGEGAGAKAQLGNLELRWRLPQGLELTGFYDYGRIRVNTNNNFRGSSDLNEYALEGLGLSISARSVTGAIFKATVARRTRDNPNSTSTGNDQDGSFNKYRWWLSLSAPF